MKPGLGEDFRERAIEYALFAGCKSGARLKQTFPQGLREQIQWEEASRVISAKSTDAPPADPQHIAAAILRHKPRIVIVFGNIARWGTQTQWRGPLVIAPHPAARHPDIIEQLQDAAKKLDRLLRTVPIE
jgi:hypothetical protein